ncbi:MAG: histone deacetylase [Planctomycetota bacterium]
MRQPEFVYHPDYYCDIGNHVFRTEKYGLLYKKLINTSVLRPANLIKPTPATREQLNLVHTTEYIDDLLAGRRTTRTQSSEMPISPEITRAFILGAGGTIEACRTALLHHTGTMNLAGGFHHAYPGHAEGFCYINDVAVGIQDLLTEDLAARPLIVDCDLHQGNGTAYIFRNTTNVYTLSIHQEQLYPPKENGDCDIPLPNLCDGDRYIRKLRTPFVKALETHKPDFVLYVAGADPYRKDTLGSLSLTLDDMRSRDDLVIGACMDQGIPVAVVLAGGYASDVHDTVQIHYQTAQVLIDHWGSE